MSKKVFITGALVGITLLAVQGGGAAQAQAGDRVFSFARPLGRIDCLHLNADGTFLHVATRLTVSGFWFESQGAWTAYATGCEFDPALGLPPCQITTTNDLSYGGTLPMGGPANSRRAGGTPGGGTNGRSVAQQRSADTGDLVFALEFNLTRDDSCVPVSG